MFKSRTERAVGWVPLGEVYWQSLGESEGVGSAGETIELDRGESKARRWLINWENKTEEMKGRNRLRTLNAFEIEILTDLRGALRCLINIWLKGCFSRMWVIDHLPSTGICLMLSKVGAVYS